MRELVDDLRDAVTRDPNPWDETLYERAADEIERLRAQLAAAREANHKVMWDDTLIPIAEALGVSTVDEHGETRRQLEMVEAIVREARGG